MKYIAPFGSSDPNAPYVDRNTPGATSGSRVPGLAVEQVQREMVGFVAKSGLTPSSVDLLQVARAVRSQRLNYVTVGGTSNALTATLDPVPASYADLIGTPLMLVPLTTNTDASVINLNGLGNIPIVRMDGNAVQRGDLRAGQLTPAAYNGTSLQMLGFAPSLAKVRVLANFTIYVNASTGNDSNIGTAGAPFLTLQAATNYVYRNLDLNGFTVTFVTTGNFTAGVSIGGLFQGQSTAGQVIYSLGTSAVTATNSSCFSVEAGKITVLQGGQLTATGTGSGMGSHLLCSGGGEIQYSQTSHGNATNAHMLATSGGRITATGSYIISSTSALYHVSTVTGGIISISGVTVTMTAILTAVAFASALGGSIYASGTVFTGTNASTVANKFSADLFGTIFVNGAGINFLPGNGAGTATSKGDYR